MRALVWLLVLAGLSVGLAIAARYNEGYLLMVIPPWRIELSLNLFLLLLASGYVLIYLLSRSLSHLMSLPQRVADFQVRRRHANAERALHDAWRLIQEGRYGQALKIAEKAWPDHATPGLVALAGWRAAHALRDPQRAAPWIERVQNMNAPTLDAARLMMEAELALTEHRFKDAKTVLAHVMRKGGRHIAALRLSVRAEQGLGNWQEVARLTRQLEKYKGLTPDQAIPLRRHAVREVLVSLHDDAPGLVRYWLTLDENDRVDPAVAAEAAKGLTASGSVQAARQVIEEALAKAWDHRLVLAYSEPSPAMAAMAAMANQTTAATGEVVRRIAQAEHWLQSHPQDNMLLLTLGRLCCQQQLWGKARSYLEASLAIRPSRTVHLALARLYEQFQESELAAQQYRAAALL